MNQEKVLSVLLGPIVSEKSTLASANNQYVFKVRTDSTKREIRTAVESLFGVTVHNVTTSNVKGKKKIYKGKTGQRINWKKAVVKVSEGQMIDTTAS
jgi:large subunit ribosomal protein L23